jgi:uncharacterized protein YdaT
MRQRVLVSAFVVFLCACLLVPAILPAGPTKAERSEIQGMINRGNKLREKYEKERAEFIKEAKEWQADPTEENRDEALQELDEMDDAADDLKANRDSIIAKVDSVFETNEPAGTDVQYDPECTDYGYTSEKCFVRLCEPAFEDPDEVATTKIHEFEHVRQKAAGKWGPGNTPQYCTFRFHELEFDAYEAEMDADFGSRTTLDLDEKLEILRRKLEHLKGMLDALAAQFEGDKVEKTLPGKTMDKSITIVNDSDEVREVYGYFDDQQGWFIFPSEFSFWLEGEQESTFTITVEIPLTAELGSGNEVMCHAFLNEGPMSRGFQPFFADSAMAFFFIHVIPGVDVVAGPDVSGVTGEDAAVYFTIVNEGDVPDTFDVHMSSTLGWPLSDDSWIVALYPTESIDLESYITFPDSAPYTTDLVYCTARSMTDPVHADSMWLDAMVEPSAGVDDGTEAKVFALMPNAPNPFAGTTMIRFSIPARSPVDLKIYDVRGRLVKSLLTSDSGAMAAGMHEVVWDGRDNNRRTVASGVYFYRLSAGERSATRKMVMLR